MKGTDVAVSEEDMADLCKMEIWALKNMIRPDTLRIGTAFDKMMDAVKRRSSQRHQDVNTAIERCFSAFSGRGNNSLSIHQFARRLSVLSMEWSGNFSKEEYLALAQDLSEEDTPGTVTLESFKSAAKNSAVFLSPGGWGTKGNGSSNRPTTARDVSQEGSLGCHVNEFDTEVRERKGSCARSARQSEGRITSTEATLETTLQQAASNARAMGQDVWKLLDACVQAALGERQQEDDRTLTSEDVAAQIYLGPEVVHRFLPKLGVRVVPSPSSPSSCPLRQSDGTTGEEQQQPDQPAAADSSRSPRHRQEVAGEAPPPVSSFLSARNAFEARSRGSRQGSPVRTTTSPIPSSSSSSSPQFASARHAFESKTKGIRKGQSEKSGEAQSPSSPSSHPPSPPSKEAASICDRYLRALSRDTASVRCRVQFYNQELARTLQETEALVSRAAATNTKYSESCGHPPQLPPATDRSSAARRGRGGGAGGRSVAAEVGGGTAAMSSAGGGGAARMSPTGPMGGFLRVTPVGRVDPSHPRMELTSRPGSTPPALSPSTCGGKAQSPSRESGKPPTEGGSGPGEPRISAGKSRRKSSSSCSSDKAKVAVSDRVAKLLLAALDETKANPSSPAAAAASPAAAERRKIAVTPKNACFDPPTVRNGLSGLTPGHVDEVLLRVEASTPGAVSSWNSPGSRRRPRTGGTDLLTPSTPSKGLAEEAQGQRRRDLHISHGSLGWFDAEGSAKGILQGVGAQQAATGDWLGARKKKGGGGARRKHSILQIKLPPRTPRTPSKVGRDNNGTIQAAPASAQRKGSWGIEHVEWVSIVDDDDDDDAEGDASEDFTGKNPMYARPVETVEEKSIQQRTLPAPAKRMFSFAQRRARGGGGGPSDKTGGGGSYGASPSRSARRKNTTGEAHPYDSGSSAAYARSTRRPVRAFQKLDDDVYDEFLNCAKKKPKASRGFQRMGTIG